MQPRSSKVDYSLKSYHSATYTSTQTLKPEVASKKEERDLVRAYRLFWLTFIIFFASTIGGKLWDRVWHLTHRFDNFWSPPHFFVFVMTAATGLLVASIAFTPRLRNWYGPTIRVPFLPFRVPGTLVILGGGLIALSFTIMFDNFWHSNFGLDETQWSAPHDMLGWSWFTIIIGFVAARLAFRRYRPINWVTNTVIGLLVLEFLCSPILGPFYLNYSISLVKAIIASPVIRTEPSAVHAYSVYVHYGLTRQSSPLFIPMVALFAGTATTLLYCLDRRARTFLLAPLLWSLFLMGRDLYTIFFLHYHGIRQVAEIMEVALKEPSLWVPIPLLVVVATFLLLKRSSFSENRIYILSGVLFGLCTYMIWNDGRWELVLAIPAGLATMYGAWMGKWLYRMIEKPSLARILKFMTVACVLVPVPLGVIDLIMRWTTM